MPTMGHKLALHEIGLGCLIPSCVNRIFAVHCVALNFQEWLKGRYKKGFQTIKHDFTNISAQCLLGS